MKITVISELTIYNDLVKLCRNKSISIEKKIALSIEKLSLENKIYKNILPPLSLLNEVDEKKLINELKDLNFTNKSPLAA